MQAFLKNQILFRGDTQYKVVRAISATEVQLENTISGELSIHKVFNLLNEYSQGTLLTSPRKKHLLHKGVTPPATHQRIEGLSTAAKIETRRRIDYLTQLHVLGSFSKCRQELLKDINQVSTLRKEPRPPHVTTVYRWQMRFAKANEDVRGLFCAFGKKGGKGQGRFDPEVEGIIHEKIETVFLTKKKAVLKMFSTPCFWKFSESTPRALKMTG